MKRESVKQEAEEIYELFVENPGTKRIVSTSIRNFLLKDYETFIHNAKLYYFHSKNEGGGLYQVYAMPAYPKHPKNKNSQASNPYENKRKEWSYVCEGDIEGELPDDYIDFKDNIHEVNDSPDVLALDYDDKPFILRLRHNKAITSEGDEKYYWISPENSPHSSYSCRLGKIKCWQFIHYPQKKKIL